MKRQRIRRPQQMTGHKRPWPSGLRPGRGLTYPPAQSAFQRDALQRAWLSVRGNSGNGANATVAEFEVNLDEHIDQLHWELRRGTYMPTPVKRILIPKANAKLRPITLWAIRDRVVQRAVYDYLEPVWEPHFLSCSHGFRSGLSTKTAAEAIREARLAGAIWVFDADIKNCFGSMDNRRVLRLCQQWRVPKAVYGLIEKWLHARVLNAWQGSPNTAGTSQGGVVSPLLCNLYLHALDRAMQKKGWHLVRYADDFVVLAQSEKGVQAAARHASSTLKQIGLQMHPQKSSITTFEEGFQFIGWFFVRDEMYRLK